MMDGHCNIYKMKFNKKIELSNKIISENKPVFIIAEAGVNHDGDINKAKKLIDVAVDSGADAVKFQAFKTENLILKDVNKAPYQKKTTDSNQSQFEMLKSLEITKNQNKDLISYCDRKGIIFLSTPFDEESLDELVDLNIPAFKVASTDTTNLLFLKKIAQTNKPIFLSTGMSFLEEIKLALKEIYQYNKNVVLLQCTANYPIRDNDANLNVISTFKSKFDILVGYSDHSTGIGASPYAIPLGAKVVEKHFTLDTDQSGPDHKASLNPNELKKYVKEIRRVESFMGSCIKEPTNDELETRKSLQKCLVASQKISMNDVFTESNIVAKRTGGVGISPIFYKDLLKKKSSREYNINDIINE